MPNTQQLNQAVYIGVFVQLNDAISYMVIPRQTLNEPSLPTDILQYKSTDPQRFKALQRDHEYKHYEHICKLLNIKNGIRIYSIGNKHDQQNNDYAKTFNGRIQDLPIDFSTHVLILRVDPTLLPETFKVPLSSELMITSNARL